MIRAVPRSPLNSSTVAPPVPASMGMLLGIMLITLIGVLISTQACALPLNTLRFTRKPFAVSGKVIAPATCPALSRAATRGATALPRLSCVNTITWAPSACATADTSFVSCWPSSVFTARATTTLFALNAPSWSAGASPKVTAVTVVPDASATLRP